MCELLGILWPESSIRLFAYNICWQLRRLIKTHWIYNVPVRYVRLSVCLRFSQFTQLFFMQYMGMCVLHLSFYNFSICENTCSGLGRETMARSAYLYMIYMYSMIHSPLIYLVAIRVCEPSNPIYPVWTIGIVPWWCSTVSWYTISLTLGRLFYNLWWFLSNRYVNNQGISIQMGLKNIRSNLQAYHPGAMIPLFICQ